MYNTAINLLKKINNSGFEAYIVGGYPRDMYLNRSSIDVDICTNATPKDLKDIFGDIMLPSVQYGSVTVIANKIRFEITTYRKDLKYANNRYPVKIKYIDNLYDDLLRRDFTINTLCMDQDGNTIDLLGSKKDLDDKVIRMVGNPRKRLKEDALRILRGIRFATILNFRLDDELKKYIKRYGKLLKNLTYYRKKEELDKIFSSSNVEYGINLIKELGLDKYLDLKNINKLVITTSTIGIWAQLDVLDKYNFSNNEKEMITKIYKLYNEDLLDEDVLYNYGLYLVSLVGEIKGIDRKLITIAYNELPIKSKIEIEISAKEICEILDRKPDSFLKRIYSILEYNIIHKKLDNDNEILREYIEKTYKNKSI